MTLPGQWTVLNPSIIIAQALGIPHSFVPSFTLDAPLSLPASSPSLNFSISAAGPFFISSIDFH